MALHGNPSLWANNNGAATYLTMDPDTGLGEYIVEGQTYVVQDNGQAPLSKDQVWGLQEMVNCLMDVYPNGKGKATLERWAEEYKRQTWKPPSGTGGVAIYRPRSV